jgi:hypothetical protein
MASFLPAFKGAGRPGLRRIDEIGVQVTVGDDVRAPFGGSSADQGAAGLLVANLATGTGTGTGSGSGTGLILFPRAAALPSVWVGSVPAAGLTPDLLPAARAR